MTFIRDPLWNNIRVDPTAERLLDTGFVQRLRYVRQLGLAHLVYPGATHSRFEHALGAYHLDLTDAELRGAPSFASDKEFDWGDRSREAEIHAYYGVPPYWGVF